MIKVSLAVGLKGELGDSSSPNGLPWKMNPEDMEYFKSNTLGKTVVMGRNTFEALPFESGLPNRDNWVLSSCVEPLSKIGYLPVSPSAKYVNSQFLKSWIQLDKNFEEFWIIGGKTLYEQFIPECDEVHVTIMEDTYPDADTILDLVPLLEGFTKCNVTRLNEYSYVEVWRK